MLKKLIAAFAFLVPAVVGQACADDFCDVGASHCTSASAYSYCYRAGDQPGPSQLSTSSCPAEQHCVATSRDVAACVGAGVGGACKTDQGCETELRCDQGLCVMPPDTDVALCNAAPSITLPDKGSTDIDVAINGTDGHFVQLLVRDYLAANALPTDPAATRFAIFHVAPSASTSGPIVAPEPNDGTGPILVLLTLKCSRLYDTTATNALTVSTEPDAFIAVAKSTFTGPTLKIYGAASKSLSRYAASPMCTLARSARASNDAECMRSSPSQATSMTKSHPLGCHGPRVPNRAAMDAILFVLRTSCQWHALKAKGICSSSSAHRRLGGASLWATTNHT